MVEITSAFLGLYLLMMLKHWQPGAVPTALSRADPFPNPHGPSLMQLLAICCCPQRAELSAALHSL